MKLFFCLANFLSTQTAHLTSGQSIALPGINRDVYAKPGDINIGSIMMLTTTTNEFGCSKTPYPNSWNIEYPEAVAFVVDKINKDDKILPNVTLGFYLVDDCSDQKYALSQAATFLPRVVASCQAEKCNGTLKPDISYALSSRFHSEPIPQYEVMGILAPFLSISAAPVSLLLSIAKMPIVGYTTTSDELSDRQLHPYYLRVVTADKYQAIAMLKFISSFGWTYISIVYSAGTYGERAFDTLKTYAPRYNICIATTNRVANEDDTDPVALDLLHYPRARVVVLFADQKPVRSLFGSVARMNATGKFIWVCCDSVTTASIEVLREHRGNIIGAFLFMYNTVIVPEFYDYIRRQNVSESKNPWFKQAWETTAGCSFANNTCNTSDDITKKAKFGKMLGPSLAMDAVLTFAHGVHNLISDICPGATGASARTCVKRDLLLQYLTNVSFQGYTGPIKFNKRSDFRGSYIINQMTYSCIDKPESNNTSGDCTKDLVQKTVAYYNSSNDFLKSSNISISWSHLMAAERVVPPSERSFDSDVPESVCSRPCRSDEYKIQKELVCCWDCRRCRDNEKLRHEIGGCEECELFTWPDPDTDYTTCISITPSHPLPTDTLPVILIIVSIIAISGTCFVACCYVYYRESRVIKAASRELSFLQMGGVFAGYSTVICFQTTPTPSMCSVLYFMFCLSFAWLYSPLLVKTVRIYRIFQSGSKNNQRPSFISPRSQVLFSFAIIFSQVALCLVMYIHFKPTSKKTQAVPSEKMVELSCDMTLPGIVSFLAYNLVLVCACAMFAFKTRRLPDNFNESRFISMCVYTTLVIWLAFIPTYFTASMESIRGLLLSVALLLNHTVAVIFLFLPKLYAIRYMATECLNNHKLHTGDTHIASGCSNRVGAMNNETSHRGF
ncbi:hypothetical protein BsWGS_09250 [Bradybaena similaris]